MFRIIKGIKRAVVFFLISTAFACTVEPDVTEKKNIIPTNGLLAWYPFNGNAMDESGNNLNGQITGASLTQDRNSKGNSAFKFDFVGKGGSTVNNEIYIPFKPILNQERISVSVWVNPKSYFWPGDPNNPNSAIIRRFEQGYSNPNGQSWGIGFSKTEFYAFLLEASSGNNQKSSVLKSSIPLAIGKWVNITFTFDSTVFKLYLNGQLIKEVSPNISINKMGSSGISIGVSRQANGF